MSEAPFQSNDPHDERCVRCGRVGPDRRTLRHACRRGVGRNGN